MSNGLRNVPTRFRAYQLGTPGSSFSYWADGHFTLIEAMVTDLSRPCLLDELKACGKRTIDTLHITSWDRDHCSPPALEWLLEHLRPSRIEYPGYAPHTDCGKEALALILSYRRRSMAQRSVVAQRIDPDYISSLDRAENLGYRDILYHPKQMFDSANDNSTVKMFRTGAFNVLSLGDVESPDIAALLQRCGILCREVDVMILAHHGADNGFTTRRLLEKLSPQIAICSSDHSNQYDHPRQEIRDLLREQQIRLFTTKTGDVVLHSTGGHTMDFTLTNYQAKTTEISSQYQYRSRKSHFLRMNQDTIRATFARQNRGPSLRG